MKKFVFILGLAALSFPAGLQAALIFSFDGLSAVSAAEGTALSITVLAKVTNDVDLQGLQMIAEVGGPAQITSLVFNNPLFQPPAAGPAADTVVDVLDPAFFVVGIVMDSNPTDNGGVAEVISPVMTEIVALELSGIAPAAGTTEVWTLSWIDGAHSISPLAPVLDNIVVSGGLGIGVPEGLLVQDYALSVTGLPAVIPEPATFVLLGFGVACALGCSRRRKRQAAA